MPIPKTSLRDMPMPETSIRNVPIPGTSLKPISTGNSISHEPALQRSPHSRKMFVAEQLARHHIRITLRAYTGVCSIKKAHTGSRCVHIKKGRSHMTQDRFQIPPDRQKGDEQDRPVPCRARIRWILAVPDIFVPCPYDLCRAKYLHALPL